MVTIIKSDLEFILAQIKFSEAHAAGTPLTSVNGGILGLDPTLPYGLRTVDGRDNNVLPGQTDFGAADTLFPRLVPRDVTTPPTGAIIDAQPRIASNLVVDQSSANPAAVAAFNAAHPDLVPQTVQPRLLPDGSANPAFIPVLVIENVAPDVGLSAPFNSWMTLFGQFFDHGLDLVTKGGNSIVLVPLQPDDSLFNPASPQTNFMVLTRATPFAGPGADGVVGTPDDTVESQNTTTSFVDQNQTYTSHSSHQVFLREYALNADGKPVATGRLLDGANGGIPTWAEVKAQALTMLGINLGNGDVGRVPLLLTDEYGRFIPDAVTGFAQIVTGTNPDGTPIVASGTPAAPVAAQSALSTGHGFLDDIANHAAPGLVDHDNDPATPRIQKTADADPGTTDDGNPLTFDDELLDAHFVTGDGRGNENIGLTSVHHIFHQEHNRVLAVNQETILATGDLAFINEWLITDLVALPAPGDVLNWDGERLFQAARFTTEMQYQHLVFEEFARKVSPSVNVFAGYDQSIDASIVAEFAHVVYRFGHSMLTETVDRIGADGQPLQQLDANGNPVFEADGVTPVLEEMGLIQAFLNPLAYNATGAQAGGVGTTIADNAAGAVIRGMTRQVGNEIDEFVTDALRDNLLGLPLDLATINMARAREQGVPTLNEARREFYEGTAASSVNGIGDSLLKPYVSWADFAANIKNPLSIVNFIAAYGTHSTITAVDTIEAKRAAATLLVLGGPGEPADRVAFLTSTGAYANLAGGITTTGLDDVDLWLGGLAERKMPFGGLLGSTFNFVFETQMEKLQDGDRFYYLTRTAGMNFLSELENNSFTSLIERNTDLGSDGMHLPGDIFSAPGHILEVDQTKQIGPDPVHEPTGDVILDAIRALNPLVDRALPATAVGYDNYLRYNGDQHVVLGGTDTTNDILIASEGDDTLWGDGGNDWLEGGAGNDILNGGDGDDIIQDIFGDDNFKGGEGNDAIHSGAGFFDLILAGGGNDFTVGGADVTETFGGRGNDYISAGPGADTVFGNEGDDWIEGGDQADLLQGDNGAPFQDSQVVGNDVIIGQGGNDDYDSESGDDIMVAGPGVSRFEGMLGFDWVTYERDPLAANADLFLTGLLPPDLDANRDRYDLAEGVSGGVFDDVIRGDNADTVFLTNVDLASGQNNAINNAGQIALIDGLQGILGAGVTTFSGGNILLGGAGSDVLEGRGGNDIIDGDSMLNVRISIRANADGSGVEIGTSDGMSTTVSSNDPALDGRNLSELIFAGAINPGQLSIVREIVNEAAVADVDTAVFSDITANYIFIGNDDGSVTIAHDVGGVAGVDGTDTLRNIEQVQFADGLFNINDLLTNINVDPVALADSATTTPGVAVAINVLANDTDANFGQALTITEIEGTAILDGDTVAVTNGTVTLLGTQLRFAPAPGFLGSAVFNYTVADGAGGLASASVVVAVGGTNAAPSITSNGGGTTAAISIPENTTAVTDVNGVDAQTLVNAVFSISGGADQARFTINPVTGVLAFIAAPDADVPGDVGANNVYNVTVRLTDASGLFDEQGLAVTVTNVNDAPTGTTLTGTIVNEFAANGTVVGTLSAIDVDGDALTFQFANGTNTFGPFQIIGNLLRVLNGVAIDFEQLAAINLSIRAVDPSGAVSALAAVQVTVTDINPENVSGTAAGEAIVGGGLADTISGNDGNDTLIGGDSGDTLIGGAGADAMSGGAGDDVIWFDELDTALDGGTGMDHLLQIGNTSIIRAVGGLGFEVIQTGGGNDVIDGAGAPGAMIIYSGNGIDTLTLGAAGGHLFGQGDNDTLTGSTGADNLIGGAGTDSLSGGGGDDVVYIDAADGNGFDGGTGLDYAIVDTNAAVNVTLNGRNVEVFIGNAGNDNIDATGTTAAMTLYGGGGNDTITAGAGASTMFGEGGNDTITGGNSNDLIIGGAGSDVMSGGGGNDTIYVDAQDVTVDGGTGNDTLVVETAAGANLAIGSSSIEVVIGNAGNDVVNATGATSAVTFFGGAGSDTLTGGLAGDTFVISADGGHDVIDGGAATDNVLIFGDATAETYRIYARADALAAGITAIAANTEIVVTRNGTTDASVIAELDNIEELQIVGQGGGDTFIPIGNFNPTSLAFNTIRVAGGADSDIVDITGLQSEHRVVFTSNGGNDTLVGTARPQDVIDATPEAAAPNGEPQVQRVLDEGQKSADKAPSPFLVYLEGSGDDTFEFNETAANDDHGSGLQAGDTIDLSPINPMMQFDDAATACAISPDDFAPMGDQNLRTDDHGKRVADHAEDDANHRMATRSDFG